MKRLLQAAALAALFASPARADILSEAAGKYRIEPQSKISFTVDQVGGGGIAGVFSAFTGEFFLSAKSIDQSTVRFTLMPVGIQTKDKRIENFLRSSAVFDAEKYPQVTFRSTKVTQVNATTAKIDGVLTARGISKAARFQAELMARKGREISFRVTGKVLRSPFGMDVGTPIYSNVVAFDMILAGRK
jgi:polyisoprenoid-binding protein YceI